MCILITGAAGFIGYSLAKRLIQAGKPIVCIDNFNDYYDPSLKESRYRSLQLLANEYKSKLIMYRCDLENKDKMEHIFTTHKPTEVVNLAAQAGVRYSLENPSAYINSNLVGFGNILENCKQNNVKNLLYASSSSVYGGNTKLPFSEKHTVDHPVSLYAATKKANELMAHVYSHLFELPATGLRFFTVYGPWGRPDMALFLFTKSIINNEPIKVFNNGDMIRDFTYIDDIVETLIRLLNKPSTKNNSFDTNNPDSSTSWAPHRVFNVGNSNPVNLMDYIKAIENSLNLKAKINYLPLQSGDVAKTSAKTTLLEEWIDFKPNTPVEKGVEKFVEWYKEFYKF